MDEPEEIMLSVISQTQEDKYCIDNLFEVLKIGSSVPGIL